MTKPSALDSNATKRILTACESIVAISDDRPAPPIAYSSSAVLSARADTVGERPTRIYSLGGSDTPEDVRRWAEENPATLIYGNVTGRTAKDSELWELETIQAVSLYLRQRAAIIRNELSRR